MSFVAGLGGAARRAAVKATALHKIESEAQRACPKTEWCADFDLVRGRYVKIFSARDATATAPK